MAFRSSSSAVDQSFTNSTISCPAPSGVQAGDLLTAVFMTIRGGSEAADPSIPEWGGSTWTLRRTEALTGLASGAYSATLSIFDRIAESGEPSTYWFEAGFSTVMAVKIRCDDSPQASPYDTNSYVSGTGTAINLASLTTAQANEMLFGAVWSLGGGGGTSFTSSALTERLDSDSLWIGDTIAPSAGATGTKLVTAADSGPFMGLMAAYKVNVPSGPTINTHPSNATVTEPATANFTISATTSGGTLLYQWQVDTGGGFSNVSTGTGGTTSSYTTAALDVTDSGNEYRCVVTDDNGSTNSNAATLTVSAAAPTITGQPSNQTVTEPATATFSVTASASEGSLSYQWQVDDGGGFENVSDGSGGTSASYTTAATTTAMTGYEYRCQVTDTNGTTTSNAVTLTVNAAGGGFLPFNNLYMLS